MFLFLFTIKNIVVEKTFQRIFSRLFLGNMETMFYGFSTFGKQCFLVCPPSGNMSRKQIQTMFPGLPTFGKHG